MKERLLAVRLFLVFAIIALVVLAGPGFGEEGVSQVEEMITVLSPVGKPPLIKRSSMAPRLDTLDGKTIYLVDVRFDDGDIFLQQMKAWFNENMPKVNVKFVRKSGTYTFNDKKLWQEIKEKGHGVVMAIGH